MDGAVTHTNYLKSFREYRDTIVAGIDTAVYKAIIASFNEALFGDTSTPANDAFCGGDGESEDEMREHRRKLKELTNPLPNHPNIDGVSAHGSATPTTPLTPSGVLDVVGPGSNAESDPDPEEEHAPTPELEKLPAPKTRPAPRKKVSSVASSSTTLEGPGPAVNPAKGNKKAQKVATSQPAATRTLRKRG